MAAQRFHDLNPFGCGCAEMSCALNKITWVNVILPDPVSIQYMHYRCHDIRTIIDAHHQYSLTAVRDHRTPMPLPSI